MPKRNRPENHLRPVSALVMLFILLGDRSYSEKILLEAAAEENNENQEEEQQLAFGIKESAVTENDHQDEKEKEKAVINVFSEACHAESLLWMHKM
ncbi:MAG: hypothetical protein ACOX6S_06895 [Clostridia bacterium]